MKKINLIFALLFALTSFCYSQQREKAVTFTQLVSGQWIPLTGLTINDLRIICVEGAYSGYVIYPDNMVGPQFTDVGNGQYVMKYFTHSNFNSTIGNGYKYYCKLQRKIVSTWTDQLQFGYFWIGDFGENVDQKPVRDSVCMLYNNQTVNGNKSFSGNIAVNGTANFTNGITIGTGTAINPSAPYTGMNIGTVGLTYIGNINSGTPRLVGSPIYSNSAVYKSWVDAEIDTKIASFVSGSYQESQNIIRLIPNGTLTANQIYTTYSTALAYGSGFSTSTKQLTILVSGEGTSVSNISMALFEISSGVYAYVKDYTHWRGIGSDITFLSDGNFVDVSSQFKATALGNIVMEDINFYFDNDGQTGDITNIVFKNCKFYSNGGYINFTGCRFEGANYFSASGNNQFAFTNCTGYPIFSSNTISVTGTNLISYETPTKKLINQIGLVQLTFTGTIKASLADNNSLFLDSDNSNKLSFKSDGGTVYTINLTAR